LDGTKKRRVVLLTDDDVSVRNLVRHILEGAGFCVFSAADGIEALTFLRSYPERIDVLLADIDMPVMDGISLAEYVRREQPGIFVLLMSGRPPANISFEQLGIAFLQKPFAPEALIIRIKQLIVNPAPHDAPGEHWS
jgi:DNA-binding response OmpR family regulator